MSWWNPLRSRSGEGREQLTEASASQPLRTAPARARARAGYEWGVGQQGLTEYNQGAHLGDTDRRTLMNSLYQAFLACPWAWACVNAIAGRITAGELFLEWDANDGAGGQAQKQPRSKPSTVLALEALLAFCNPRQSIRQLIFGIIIDLLVFGDAFVEVVWLGRQPVALYSLDSPSMLPLADEHGQVTGYVQVTEHGQRAPFDPRDVIHISLGSPRSGIFGVSPTFAARLAISVWLFTAAVIKEKMRKGNPPNVHVDLKGSDEPDLWVDQYMARNLGAHNIGRPVVTKNGGAVNKIDDGSVAELAGVLSQRRDEIVSIYGVPPAMVGIIESGNIGGGDGESQQKSFDVITCNPLAAMVLDALFFHLGAEGFGIEGWRLKFGEIDLRDSAAISTQQETFFKSGAWTLNKWRSTVGEPAVEGGDEPLLITGAGAVIRVRDLDASAKAGIAKQIVGTQLEMGDPGKPDDPVVLKLAPKPDPAPGRGSAGPDPLAGPEGPDDGGPSPNDDTSPPDPESGAERPEDGAQVIDLNDDEYDEDAAHEAMLADALDDATTAELELAEAERYVDEHGLRWAWDGHRYERALDEQLLDTLLDAGAATYLDEADVVWRWSVEETKYVRTTAGAQKYGLPVGSPITAATKAAAKAKAAGGKMKFASAQKTQKKTAAHFFAAGTGDHGAIYDPETGHLTVTDAHAAAAHLAAGYASHDPNSPPKIAIGALMAKIDALGAHDDNGHQGASAAVKTPTKTPTPTEPPTPAPAAAPEPAAPTSAHIQPGKLADFAAIPDVDVEEPPMPTAAPGKRISTGMIVLEPDGRMWIIEPKGHFGGYEHTWPKGGLEDDGLTPQQSAHRELMEETGLKAEITGYVGDYQGTTGITRMYVAKRTGGTPHPDDPTPYVKGGIEAAAIKLVTPDEAQKLLNKPRDKKVLADALAKIDGSKTDAPNDADAGDGPVDVTGWQKVSGQAGSNDGGTYRAPNGDKYYIKRSKSPDHARNEVLAANLYKLAGIDHADMKLATTGSDGQLGTAGKIIPGATKDLKSKIGSDPNYKMQAQRGFAVDAWLANWDVVGANFDNMVTDGAGKPVRVDPGGSLLYRAQGTPKGAAFTSTVGEWDTLRSGSTNPNAKAVFGSMTDTQLKASAARVIAISPDQIDAEIEKAGFSGAEAKLLSKRLKSRREDVANRAGLPLPEKGTSSNATAPADPAPAVKSAPEPAAAAPTGPVPVAAPNAHNTANPTVGVVALGAKHKSQKKAATQYFGPAAGDNAGASYEDSSGKLTVTDHAAAIATVDAALAGPLGPGQKVTLNNLKAKLTAVAGHDSNGDHTTATPATPSHEPIGTATAAAASSPTAAVPAAAGQPIKPGDVPAELGVEDWQVTELTTMSSHNGSTLMLGADGEQYAFTDDIPADMAYVMANPETGELTYHAAPAAKAVAGPSKQVSPDEAVSSTGLSAAKVASIQNMSTQYKKDYFAGTTKEGKPGIVVSKSDAEHHFPYGFIQSDPAGQLTYYAMVDGGKDTVEPDLPGPTMTPGTAKVAADMGKQVGLSQADMATVRAAALGNKSKYGTKDPASGKLVLHTSSAEAKATGQPYVQVDKNGNFSYHAAGSGNSATQPKGAAKPKLPQPHVELKSTTGFVGKPDGETTEQRATRVAAEHEAANAAALQYKSTTQASLTKAEIAAIHSYGGNGYQSLNDGLRHPPPSKIDLAKQRKLDAAMLKYQLPAERVVWRGTGSWIPPVGLAAGDVFEDLGFSSTSFASDRAFSGVRLEITVPQGFHAISINGADPNPPHPSEKELLLPRGTRFAVVSDEMKGGQRWMQVEAIPPAYLLTT